MSDTRIYRVSPEDLPSLAKSLGEENVLQIGVTPGEKTGDEKVSLFVDHNYPVSASDASPCRDHYTLVRGKEGEITLNETGCDGKTGTRSILVNENAWPALQLPFVVDVGPKTIIQNPWEEARKIIDDKKNPLFKILSDVKMEPLLDLWALSADDFSRSVEKIFFEKRKLPPMPEAVLRPWRSFARFIRELNLEFKEGDTLKTVEAVIVSRYPFMEESMLIQATVWATAWAMDPSRKSPAAPAEGAAPSPSPGPLIPLGKDRLEIYSKELESLFKKEKSLKRDLLRLRRAYVVELLGENEGVGKNFGEAALNEFDQKIARPVLGRLVKESPPADFVGRRVAEVVGGEKYSGNLQWEMFNDHKMDPDWEAGAYISPLISLSTDIYVDDAAISKVTLLFPEERESGSPFGVTSVHVAAAIKELHTLQKEGIDSPINRGKKEYLSDYYVKDILSAIFKLEEREFYQLTLGARHLLELEWSREEGKKEIPPPPSKEPEEETSAPWYKNGWIIAGGALVATAATIGVVAALIGEDEPPSIGISGGNGGNGGSGNGGSGNGDDGKTPRNPTITVGP